MSDSETDDMALPAGKSCADCVNYRRCQAIIGKRNCHDKQTRCDWAPSRFVAAYASLRAELESR